jgi:hypothetical protein
MAVYRGEVRIAAAYYSNWTYSNSVKERRLLHTKSLKAQTQ